MAAKTSEMWLLEAMDSLWFHHIVLFSKRPIFIFPETHKIPEPTSESTEHSSKNSSQFSVISDKISSLVTSVTNGSQSQDEASEKRPRRLNLVSSKTRSHSSSPLSHKKSNKMKQSHYPVSGLQKTTSLKSLEELELEEVKGFMDLGFNFTREKISKHLVRLIPGLQRIDGRETAAGDEEHDENEEGNGIIMRPYLSEAWLVKRADDDYPPLAPRVCRAVDMKKQLKHWARKVALVAKYDVIKIKKNK